MNPYEDTASEMRRQSEGPLRAAKRGVGVAAAAGAASFAPLLAKAAPFLSQYIPENLAIKGLSKISPNLGKFVKDATDNGYDFNEVKDFIGNQVKDSQTQENSKENKDIISQYSPSLFEYIKGLISNGSTPTEAATKAQKFLDPKNKQIIKQIEKDHKTPWTSIVESIFGGGQMRQNTPGNTPVDQANTPAQPTGGPGQQKLMAILDQINQKLGR
jgi:hypothetical protein